MLGALRVLPKVSAAGPLAGYYGWYDASDSATLTGSPNLTTWADKGSGAKNLTNASSSPSNGTRTVNGLNVIDFASGANRIMASANYSLSQPITYFVVVVCDLATGTGTLNASIIRDPTGSQPSIMVYSSGAANTRAWAYYAGSVRQGSVAMDNSAHVISAVFNGASSGLWVDGASASTSNPGAGTVTNGLQLASSSAFDGAIGEVLVYSSALGTSDRQSVESYLKAKWGTP